MNTSTDPDTPAVPAAPASQRLAERVAGFLGAHTSRRGFIARTAVIGSALAVNPGGFVLRPARRTPRSAGRLQTAPPATPPSAVRRTVPTSAHPARSWVAGGRPTDQATAAVDRATTSTVRTRALAAARAAAATTPSARRPASTAAATATSGSCDQRRVSCNYFRYGQCHQEIGCGGPVACRVVSCTPPYELFGECSNASATDNATTEHSAPCLPGGCPGAIEQHYYDLGGPGSFLGAQLTGEMVAPDDAGRFTNYQNGAIYWTPGTGAWEVHGAIKLE